MAYPIFHGLFATGAQWRKRGMESPTGLPAGPVLGNNDLLKNV